MTNKRLFISAEIPEDIIDDIIEIRNNIYGIDSSVKWESKEKLHITLKFLGDTEIELVESIEEKLGDILARVDSIDAEIKRFGMFKRNGIPSILMLGLFTDKKLFYLFDRIDEELSGLGFKRENRRFKPHITLLRIKGKENFEKLYSFLDYNFDKTNFRINKISLMESELKPSGSTYKTIKSFELN
ncbi:MAG: RNA 2',3'-cyclic phosphodiesterase [Ignavibacteria bacterium]|jgi:2'-5' RNA ligase